MVRLPQRLRYTLLVVAVGFAAAVAIIFAPFAFQMLPQWIGDPLWRIRWICSPAYLLCLAVFLGTEPRERA